MKNVNEIVELIKSGKVNLELIDDRVTNQKKLEMVDGSGFEKLCEFSDEEYFKALYKKDEKYFYAERQYCADNAFTGSCELQYDKLYEVEV
ncbi:hypothetical protein BD780_001337 [Clostridium tetanomorphum]|uniref:Uncharacterized protein n=1 Tax=Clostridium tetanomorphum TaxID=1553 RepID=A0A923ECN8_CLOTT|nr:hypothetical protein [Clostridium tetanomorphum]KAJ49269.1 hypothetical protein CTM_23949 [Clostridium tetanomorphum DSM 665]KAJ53941.1 hypothetical protein CTM_00225 [Clostridium tetanomorphum DSM 665]MBC2398075.1 hypothetical protein [Clostridium tetanomorphum]MBP1864642.1 hypothetical protein [Clostridium tetanomorphum]NRS84112.1 hypothetical protein [Clostridium tetanomorphum]